MSRELIAGQSGWGKSYLCQQRIEDNLDEFDSVVILDYKDEYMGLAKAGLASWLGIGRKEAALSPAGWREMMIANDALVVARKVDAETWREDVAPAVAEAAREFDGEALLVVDEAHFVARMRRSTPDRVQEVATTGRGQGVASIWVTQKIAKLDATVSSQCDRSLLGGFVDTNDIDRVDSMVSYSAEVHNPRASSPVRGVPDSIGTDPLQEFDPVGSEWIYSTRSGEYQRIDSRQLSMSSTHYGPPGTELSTPE